ncbi:hypothetical protein AAVH_02311 [Aphelenchoides avenae]|nr:hypothetical protein AAVH_02311 [Aphelenchus avenae]
MAFGKKKQPAAASKASTPSKSKDMKSKSEQKKKGSKGGFCGCLKKKDKKPKNQPPTPGTRSPAPYASFVPLDDGKKPAPKPALSSQRQKPPPGAPGPAPRRQPAPTADKEQKTAQTQESGESQRAVKAPVNTQSKAQGSNDTKSKSTSKEKLKKSQAAGSIKGPLQALTIRYYEQDGRAFRQFNYTSSWPLGDGPPHTNRHLTLTSGLPRSSSRDVSVRGRCYKKADAKKKTAATEAESDESYHCGKKWSKFPNSPTTSDASSAETSAKDKKIEFRSVTRLSSETSVECNADDYEKLKGVRNSLQKARGCIKNLETLATKPRLPGGLKPKTDAVLADIDDLLERIDNLSQKRTSA